MEHWVINDYLEQIQMDKCNLVSYFSRKSYLHGGSCIYVKKNIRTKSIKCLDGLAREIDFEMSAIELADHRYMIICI